MQQKRKKTWLDGVFGQFLRESTIHGVKYIGGRDRYTFERILWTIAVLACLGYSCYLVEEIYRKYYENPVIISFQPKETAVARIPFPAITICNINVLKKKEMLEVLKKMTNDASFKNDGIGKESMDFVQLLAEHLAHYCLAASSFRRILEERLVDSYGDGDFVNAIYDILLTFKENNGTNTLNEESIPELHRNISRYTRNATHSCEDMVLQCLWAREKVNCSEVFSSIYTSHGTCCVFNMMPKYILRKRADTDRRSLWEQKRLTKQMKQQWRDYNGARIILDVDKVGNVSYPRYQKSGGKPYGLSLLINPEIHSYGTCNSNDGYGFKVAAHSPISYPNIQDYGAIIPVHNEVFMNIIPEITTASEKDLRQYDVDKRACYFPSDPLSTLQSYKFYSDSNCMEECKARVTFERCGCVRYFMPKNDSQPLCKASKLTCAEAVRKNLTSSGRSDHCHYCRPSCSEIKYRMEVSQFPLRDYGPIYYNTSTETNQKAIKSSIVHIFYGTDSIYAKERKILFDTSDLLANAGGLLGLTLGFSIISIIEIIYFFIIRTFLKCREDKEKEDDEDFYSRSSENKGPRLSAIVRPRILDGIQLKNNNAGATGYYNWAVKASNGITKVDCDSDPTLLTAGKISKRRGGPAPNFELLSGYY